MSTPTIDYDALAAQSGGTAQAAPVDYDALAAQHGGTAASQSDKPEPGYGAGLSAGLEGLYNAVRHPIDTITNMGKQVMAGGSTPYGTPLLPPTPRQSAEGPGMKPDAQLSAQNDAAQQRAVSVTAPGSTPLGH